MDEHEKTKKPLYRCATGEIESLEELRKEDGKENRVAGENRFILLVEGQGKGRYPCDSAIPFADYG